MKINEMHEYNLSPAAEKLIREAHPGTFVVPWEEAIEFIGKESLSGFEILTDDTILECGRKIYNRERFCVVWRMYVRGSQWEPLCALGEAFLEEKGFQPFQLPEKLVTLSCIGPRGEMRINEYQLDGDENPMHYEDDDVVNPHICLASEAESILDQWVREQKTELGIG